MARRGDELREHILWAAKGVFLEMGFERASMDVVASRAETSKRSLYAHFESKEKLYLAVIGLVRELFLARLKRPQDHAQDPQEALVHFCDSYLEALLYEPSVQMCRISVAETARFPQAAAEHFDLVFAEPGRRLADYLTATFGVPRQAGEAAAERLVGRILHPRLLRALFGLDPLATSFDRDAAARDAARRDIGLAVAELIAPWQQGPASL